MSLPIQSAAIAVIAFSAAAVLGSGSPACADTAASLPPGFPASSEDRDVLTWLAAHTSVRPADVVVISPQAVVSMEGVTRGADKAAPIDAVVREELIDAALAERTHARSTRVNVELDCAASLFRIRESTRFTLPDLKGAAVMKASAGGWTHLQDGTVMLSVAHTACGTGAAPPAPAMASVPNPAPTPAPLQARAPAPAPAPVVKPSTTVAAASPEAPRPVAAAAPAKTSPPPSSEPTYWILLGSYSNTGNAHVAVAKLTRGYPGPVKGRDVVVRKTSVNGRDYFFVAVQGFRQRADASGFCKAVQAAPEDCLIRR